MAPQISADPVTCVSHQSFLSLRSRARVQVREVGSVSGLMRLLLLGVAARVLGRRERCEGWMGFKGSLGRSMGLRARGAAWCCACEAWDARGEVTELCWVEGAVMLRDDEECARTASVSESRWREAQQP